MRTVELFTIALAIIFTVPYLAWRLGRTDYWAPLVVVQIVTGVLLGPGVLGAAFPAYYDFVFEPAVVQALNGVGWWAVMLFVMIAGIELDLDSVWRSRRETAVTAGLALAAPLCLGALAALVVVQMPGWLGERGAPWQFVLGVGMACAVTALPILILFMERLGILREPLGQRILRYASLDDIAIWGVLALILMDWLRIGRQAVFIAGFALLAVLFRRLMARLPSQDRWYVAFIWLALCAWAADWSGLHFMVGAFLAGAVMESAWFDQQKLDTLRHNVLLVLMPVFFLGTGLRTTFDVGGAEVFGFAALLLVAQLAGKLLGVGLAARVLGWRRGEGSLIGWLLQTKALIMIIFANILLDTGVISGAAFTALLIMAVASTMLTIPMVTPKLRRLRAESTSAVAEQVARSSDPP
jgi:Kef-type K+ transport system membrane component KefB